MAIGFRASTNPSGTGGTADPVAAIALPTGTAAGDLVVLALWFKYSTTTIASTPTDWTAPANNETTGGAGAAGIDTGVGRIALFFREYDGVWAMPTIDLSAAPNVSMLGAISYSKGSTEAWVTPVCANTSDTTGSTTSYDPPASGTTISFAAGDWFGHFTGINGDAGTQTSVTQTVAGVTFGANNTRWNVGTATGQDARSQIADRTYTSGTASAGPDISIAYTSANANMAGATAFYRLRVVPSVSGTAAGVFGFTGTATGQPFVSGAAAGSFGFTGTALGVVGGGPVEGTAAGVFGFTGTAAGVPETFGAAAAVFGFTGAANGQPRTFGTALGSFTFTATAAGRPRSLGLAIGIFGFTGTAAGRPRSLGQAVGAFGFTGTASGITGTPPVTGTATGSFGFIGAALGQPRTFGTALATFGPTVTAQGVPRTFGQVVGAFTFTGTAAGVPKVLGQAVASFLFVGTVTVPPPVPSFVPRSGAGVVDRPAAGVVDRPFAGVVDRPGGGVVDRPFAGVVPR